MKRAIRLSIFLPRDAPFYRALLAQMLHGYRAHGFAVSGACGHADEAAASAWMAEHSPDVVLEMNRPRLAAPFWPRSVRHVAWIVDYAGRTEADMRASDILYFFDPGWVSNFPYQDAFVDHMAPGVCPRTYFPPAERKALSDVVFVGHIPPPWTDAELDRDISQTDVPLRFGDFLAPYAEARKVPTNHQGLWAEINRLLRARTGGPVRSDTTITYDLMERVPRMERQQMLDEVVDTRYSLRIFGTPGIGLWPRFAARYGGFLDDPAQVRAAYQSSNVNVHDGVLIHFRALDGIRCGALLFYQGREKTALSKFTPPRAVKVPNALIPRKHYVPFGPGQFQEVADHYLARDTVCDRIRQNAFDRVTNHHTWRHRAQKLLRDLAKV